MIYLLAGVVVGFAVGIAYISTLSNLIKWFPANKGLISGISVGAFGSGSLLFKYVNAALIADVGVSGAFFYWGAIVMGLIVVGSLLLKEPVLATNAAQGANGLGNDFSVRQMLATKEAYLLFTIFFAACMSGLYLIGIVKTWAFNWPGWIWPPPPTPCPPSPSSTPPAASSRTLSDKVGRMRVISFTMLVTVLAIVALSFMTLNHTLFFICVGAVAFCFGGNITVFPAIVGDFFGLKNHSKTTASSTGASAGRAGRFVRRQILRRLPRHLHGDWRSVRRFSADYAVHQSAEGSGSGNGRNHPNGGAGQSLIPRETTSNLWVAPLLCPISELTGACPASGADAHRHPAGPADRALS